VPPVPSSRAACLVATPRRNPEGHPLSTTPSQSSSLPLQTSGTQVGWVGVGGVSLARSPPSVVATPLSPAALAVVPPGAPASSQHRRVCAHFQRRSARRKSSLPNFAVMTKVAAAARSALAVARRSGPEFEPRRGPRKFTNHQLFALLVLRQFFRTDCRGIKVMLRRNISSTR
jgi:hypothetical protein